MTETLISKWEGENICQINNTIRGFDWVRYLYPMIFVIPVAIVTFNLCIFYRAIPEDFTVNYVILYYSHPNIISMFLSNYAHATMNHMQENMLSYILTIVMIAAVPIVAIPYMNRKSGGKLGCRFGEKTLLISTITFFLIVPFLVSAASLAASPFFNVKNGVGFSGIGYAFEGYLIYICVLLFIRKAQVMWHRGEKWWSWYGAICGIILIVTPIMFMNPLQGQSNFIAHLTGYVAGVLTPLILDRMSALRKPSNIRQSE